ncbi:maturation protein [ssRNA phage Gerhypos.1_21]|uniref:Maturation protein n=2 Tax=Leviviricetes TaxID=2842243 RepID=A0A8S5L329_9VIRU|nr:maturation protein [ssRNA phage Gerhypos.1_21]QDH90654.1 MAG: hypothetical protein H1Bulk29370_000003 [Leviviridae sp.]DAD51791.1 TPA_asm: maturation protein [ssRNA phage Gerhypos.1_21]
MNVMTGSPKIKSRSLPDTVVTDSYSDVYNNLNVLQSHNFNGNYTESTFGEQIAYTTLRKNLRAKSNQCQHLKETFHYSGGSGAMRLQNASPAGWYTDYRGHHANCCNAKASIINAVETQLVRTKGAVLGYDGQSWINSVWDYLRPDLRTVSIPNFLADIEDLKDLFQIWKKNVSIAKNLAGAHLNYKFGWKPTVGDLSDMIEGVTKLRAKLAAFKSQLGQTIQGSRGVTHGLPTSATGTIVYPSGLHTASYSASCVRKVTAYIAWQPQPLAVMGPMDEVLRGLLDSLGFELNPRIIWDAIPFTFVIDWFFGVGSWLDRFRVDALELPVALVDSFLQYEETLHIEWTWLRANDGTYTTRPKSAGATYERKFFHRMPIYPDPATLAGLGWKLPSLNQAELLLSLATVLKK